MLKSRSWAIEYSHSENSFHIGKTNEMLKRNVMSVRTGGILDFICVGIFQSKEQAEEALLEFRRNRMPANTIALL